jgi:hypothetical protein
VTGRVRVAGKGLKVAGFSASCEEFVRVARKGVRGAAGIGFIGKGSPEWKRRMEGRWRPGICVNREL